MDLESPSPILGCNPGCNKYKATITPLPSYNDKNNSDDNCIDNDDDGGHNTKLILI
jgi:hypothetical protein